MSNGSDLKCFSIGDVFHDMNAAFIMQMTTGDNYFYAHCHHPPWQQKHRRVALVTLRMSESGQDGILTSTQSSVFSTVSKKGKIGSGRHQFKFKIKKLPLDGYTVIEFHTDSISVDYSIKGLY